MMLLETANEESAKKVAYREVFRELEQELRILHLIYHRNKNQHRVAVWWRRLNMLKRNCSQVVTILRNSYDTIDHSAAATKKLYSLLHGFLADQLRKTYYEFNGVIALGQFVTLGVVLVGLLSKIYCLYQKMLHIYSEVFNKVGLAQTDTLVPRKMVEVKPLLDEEIGEAILEDAIPHAQEPLQHDKDQLLMSSVKTKRKKKKKKESKKSAIDGIFG